MSLSTDQLSLARLYISDGGSSAVQSILIRNATGGTFTITFDGQTTSALAWNASAADVQNALCALSNVGVGNLSVNNTAPYMIYFMGDLGNMAQTMLTTSAASLTPGGSTATVTAVANGGIYAFSDDELSAMYDQANLNFFLMICFAFRGLMANFARLNDYIAGQTTEKKSQIFNHLKDMADMYQEWAFAGQQVQISRLRQVPPRVTAYPFTSGIPATSLSTRPPNRWGPWGR